MKTVTLERCPINEIALHEELLAELGTEYIGLSTTPQEIVLYFVDEATMDSILLAQIIVNTHDPLILTPTQKAEQESQALLAEYPVALDTSQYANESPLIIELAERLRRLELLLGGQNAG
jgi:hypothetical protein